MMVPPHCLAAVTASTIAATWDFAPAALVVREDSGYGSATPCASRGATMAEVRTALLAQQVSEMQPLEPAGFRAYQWQVHCETQPH